MDNRKPQLPVTALSLINRKKSTRTHTQSQKNRCQKRHQSIGRTNGCQRIFSKHTSYDQCIRNIIKLLQKITRDHRQRKQDQTFADPAFCQIIIHFATLHHPHTPKIRPRFLTYRKMSEKLKPDLLCIYNHRNTGNEILP